MYEIILAYIMISIQIKQLSKKNDTELEQHCLP